MTNPKISIIIPVYNVEKYLRRCLDSLKNQTFKDWQAICVDDGSPDGSGKILDEYADKDSRFVAIHKKNGGISDARNVGLDRANGKYIMFLDSDDAIHPQTMEIVFALAEKENSDVVTFYYHRMTHKKIIEPDVIPDFFNSRIDINRVKYKTTKHLMRWVVPHEKKASSWKVQQCMVWKNLYRHDFVRDIRVPSTVRFLEDFVYWSKVMLKSPKTVITKLQLYYYTYNSTSLLNVTQQCVRVDNLLVGIQDLIENYIPNMNKYNVLVWKKRFLWDMLSRVYNAIVNNNCGVDKLIQLKKIGAFKCAPDAHARRYRKRMLNLIAKYEKQNDIKK